MKSSESMILAVANAILVPESPVFSFPKTAREKAFGLGKKNE